MQESRKCQREQELKHVGKELVGVVLVRFEGVAEMIGDAELMGGIECPFTSIPPPEKKRPDAIVGRNGIEEKSIVLMCLAAPGCFR